MEKKRAAKHHVILAPPPDVFEQLARDTGQPFNLTYSGMTDVRPQSAQRK
jgi:hypothetical protein